MTAATATVAATAAASKTAKGARGGGGDGEVGKGEEGGSPNKKKKKGEGKTIRPLGVLTRKEMEAQAQLDRQVQSVICKLLSGLSCAVMCWYCDVTLLYIHSSAQ